MRKCTIKNIYNCMFNWMDVENKFTDLHFLCLFVHEFYSVKILSPLLKRYELIFVLCSFLSFN